MNTKKRTIIGILAMIIVLTVSAGCLFGCGSSDEGEKDSDKEQSQNADEDENDEDEEKSGRSSYEIVVGDLVDAFFKEFDAEKIADLMPEKVVDLMVATNFNGNRKKFIESLQGMLDDYLDEYKDIAEDKLSKLKFNIVNVEDVDKDDVEKMNEEAKKTGFDLKLKEVKNIEIEVTIPSEDGEEEIKTITLQVAKIGNAWYVISFD